MPPPNLALDKTEILDDLILVAALRPALLPSSEAAVTLVPVA